MEEALFESAEILLKYGFRLFLFFNAHGGNGIVQSNVLHRINKTTEAVAAMKPREQRREWPGAS
jgi:creatinine amidohydrolase/Fe(II)-dependent formamide hydrolase-like protein